MDLKTCTKCRIEKPHCDFYTVRVGEAKLRALCVDCHYKETLDRKRRYPEKAREAGLKSYYKDHEKTKRKHRESKFMYQYGLTPDGLRELFESCGGCCGICGRKLALGGTRLDSARVDHDHVTGHIRGILCTKCNTAIGVLGDSIEGLRKAIFYLEQAARRYEIEQEVKRQLESIADQSFREDCDA